MELLLGLIRGLLLRGGKLEVRGTEGGGIWTKMEEFSADVY